uniref:Uncharacterized protein n=1 Tax=Oryza rufipogon TaxID=4529 RepID=A0A0E0P7U8_ORYRU
MHRRRPLRSSRATFTAPATPSRRTASFCSAVVGVRAVDPAVRGARSAACGQQIQQGKGASSDGSGRGGRARGSAQVWASAGDENGHNEGRTEMANVARVLIDLGRVGPSFSGA